MTMKKGKLLCALLLAFTILGQLTYTASADVVAGTASTHDGRRTTSTGSGSVNFTSRNRWDSGKISSTDTYGDSKATNATLIPTDFGSRSPKTTTSNQRGAGRTTSIEGMTFSGGGNAKIQYASVISCVKDWGPNTCSSETQLWNPKR